MISRLRTFDRGGGKQRSTAWPGGNGPIITAIWIACRSEVRAGGLRLSLTRTRGALGGRAPANRMKFILLYDRFFCRSSSAATPALLFPPYGTLKFFRSAVQTVRLGVTIGRGLFPTNGMICLFVSCLLFCVILYAPLVLSGRAGTVTVTARCCQARRCSGSDAH